MFVCSAMKGCITEVTTEVSKLVCPFDTSADPTADDDDDDDDNNDDGDNNEEFCNPESNNSLI